MSVDSDINRLHRLINHASTKLNKAQDLSDRTDEYDKIVEQHREIHYQMNKTIRDLKESIKSQSSPKNSKKADKL